MEIFSPLLIKNIGGKAKMNERKLFQDMNYRSSKKKKRNSLKKDRGITLIALVISIIVMLILAGVSLNAVIRR